MENFFGREIALHFWSPGAWVAREAAPGLHRPKRNRR
jgi:hypothetical protein